MRIGIFTDSYKPYVSGVSTSIYTLAEGLIAAGHDVYIITPKYKGYKEYDKDYNYIIRIKGIRLPKRGATFLKYIPFVGRHLRRIDKLDLDVIHVHSELTIGKLAIKARKKLDIPIVYTVHTMYEEYLHFVSKFLAKHWKAPLMRIVKAKMRRFISNSDVTIVPSKKIKDLMISYDIEGDYNIVPTGIDLSKFKNETYKEADVLKVKESLNLKPDEFICLYVGRISLEKDIDMLIDGFKMVNHDKIKFVIVGGGPHLKTIKERVLKEGLGDKIIFTGIVPTKDVGLYYQIGDVFLSASISETQGLTYIEALAAKMPLIVRYDAVLENVLTEGYNGMFFYETKEIPQRILELYEDKDLTNKLKENTLESVKKFDDKTYIKNALKMYERAINKRHKEE